jgi:hypothetical protein
VTNGSACSIFVLTPQQFESLKDGDLISMYNGEPANAEDLEKAFEQGEPSTVLGTKFGRLDKSLLDSSAPIERSASDH